jgi:hypothetical protein
MSVAVEEGSVRAAQHAEVTASMELRKRPRHRGAVLEASPHLGCIRRGRLYVMVRHRALQDMMKQGPEKNKEDECTMRSTVTAGLSHRPSGLRQ